MTAEREHRQAGYTLAEVLVAIAILGLGLAGFYRVLGGSLLASTTASRQRDTILFVDNLVAELGRSRRLTDGDSTGTLPDGRPWRLHVSAYPTREPGREPPALQAHLVRIEVGDHDRFDTLLVLPP